MSSFLLNETSLQILNQTTFPNFSRELSREKLVKNQEKVNTYLRLA